VRIRHGNGETGATDDGRRAGQRHQMSSPTLGQLRQESTNFVVGAIGFACQSGDTLGAVIGTSRQSSIPAATAVGVALYDNTTLAKGHTENQ
jgi:hypothetical protein